MVAPADSRRAVDCDLLRAAPLRLRFTPRTLARAPTLCNWRITEIHMYQPTSSLMPHGPWGLCASVLGSARSGIDRQCRAPQVRRVAHVFLAVRAFPNELASAETNWRARPVAAIDDGWHLTFRAGWLGCAAAQHRRVAADAVFACSGPLVGPIWTDQHGCEGDAVATAILGGLGGARVLSLTIDVLDAMPNVVAPSADTFVHRWARFGRGALDLT